MVRSIDNRGLSAGIKRLIFLRNNPRLSIIENISLEIIDNPN
jgi:hypothetical protein